MRIPIPMEYTIAVKAIHPATDFAVGLTFKIITPDMTIPTPMTSIPLTPEIKLASWAARLNCVSMYFGKNVYNPATGSKCKTDDAVRNIRMSLFNWRLMVLGKSVFYKWKLLVFYCAN